jgi:hypothetical protein
LSFETKEMLKLYDSLLPDTQKVIREYIYEMYELQELRKQALKAQSQPLITVSNLAAEPDLAAEGGRGRRGGKSAGLTPAYPTNSITRREPVRYSPSRRISGLFNTYCSPDISGVY